MHCSHYHAGRPFAISVGVAATGGALAILLADPVTTGNWRLDHVLLPVIVAITIASGHLFGSALRGWRILPAMGFALIFAVGTVLTVYSERRRPEDGRRRTAGRGHRRTLNSRGSGQSKQGRWASDPGRLPARRGPESRGQRAVHDLEAHGVLPGRHPADSIAAASRYSGFGLRTARLGSAISCSSRRRQLATEASCWRSAEKIAPSKARPFAEALGVPGLRCRQGREDRGDLRTLRVQLALRADRDRGIRLWFQPAVVADASAEVPSDRCQRHAAHAASASPAAAPQLRMPGWSNSWSASARVMAGIQASPRCRLPSLARRHRPLSAIARATRRMSPGSGWPEGGNEPSRVAISDGCHPSSLMRGGNATE